MAKKNKRNKISKKKVRVSKVKAVPPVLKLLPWLLGLFAFILYANTLGHQYALDDASVITDNFLVKKGLAGWPEIFTTHYRFGYWNSTGTLYRPISLAIFALVWQISSDNPFLYHLVNVLAFAATIVVLLKTLRAFWPELHVYLVAAITVIFLTHPVHVEVVANIKSLDEILSFLFSLMAIRFYIKFLEKEKNNHLVVAIACYTFALFSKENAITFLAVFPLVGYYYSSDKNQNWLKSSLVFLVPAAIFLTCRFMVLKTQSLETVSPLDNLLMATNSSVEWYATAILLIGKYLWTLLIPLELGSDFGYNQIPATGFGNVKVLLSLFSILGLLVLGIWGLIKKNKAAFGILFFIISFSIYSNLFIQIGSSYGERFLYVASLGYAIALVMALHYFCVKNLKLSGKEKFNLKKYGVLFAVTGLLGLFYATRTVLRNSAWYNSYSLYKTDINAAPNSAKLNYHLGLEEVKEALKTKDQNQKLQQQQNAFTHFRRAIELYPTYGDAYGQLGLAYYRQKQPKEALENYQIALKYDPNDAKVYSNMGVIYFENKNLEKAEEVYLKAVELDPRYIDARRNLGSVYAQTGRFDQAITQFSEGLNYDPNNAILNLYLGYAYRDKGDVNRANKYLEKAYQLDSKLRR